MAMNLTTRLRTGVSVPVCLAVMAMVACTPPSQTAPTPVQAAPTASTPAPPPAPVAGPGKLEIAITPNPVPWSDQPVEGCSLPNTWRYDQTLSNSGGTRLTISDRADSFDGVQVSTRSGLGIVLAPGGQVVLHTRWCSANSTEHVTRTTFSGSDDGGNRIEVAGPAVRLRAR